MLEEKLQQASQSSQKQGKRTLLLLTLGLLFCVGAVVLMSFVESKSPKPVPLQASSTLKPQLAANQRGLREAVMKRLQAYEEELEAAIVRANPEQWNLKKSIELKALKEDVVSSFAKGDYILATQKLDRLELLAKQLLTDWNTTFSSEKMMAGNALQQDDYVVGKLHITKAISLKPHDLEAKALLANLEALPELLKLLKLADVAHIENNPEKEYSVLEKAFAIAPYRDGLKHRRDVLAEKLKEIQFGNRISSAWRNVERNEIKAARLNYNQAKQLYATRSELKLLNDAIIKATVALDLNHSIRAADQAIRQDEWLTAERIYAESLQRHPQNRAIRDGLQLATKVVSLQASLSDYINRPDRLSSQNISTAAKETLIQADVFAGNSKRLSVQVAELKTLLAKVNIKVPVFVKSDNKTYILVRGVGKVGLTPGREIRLKPGAYTFEGSRSGYRSKLVQVRVPLGELMVRVEVVCDERI